MQGSLVPSLVTRRAFAQPLSLNNLAYYSRIIPESAEDLLFSKLFMNNVRSPTPKPWTVILPYAFALMGSWSAIVGGRGRAVLLCVGGFRSPRCPGMLGKCDPTTLAGTLILLLHYLTPSHRLFGSFPQLIVCHISHTLHGQFGKVYMPRDGGVGEMCVCV